MEEKPNYYAIIPAEVKYDKQLKPNEKLLYGEITSLATKTGECWASNNYFADLYEVEPETISRWIKDLKDRGYITTRIDYKEGTKEIEKRAIIIEGGIDKKINRGIDKKINRGIDKKVKGNKQEVNNTRINREETNKEEKKGLFEYLETQLGRLLNPLEFEIANSWEDTPTTRSTIDQAIKQGGRSVQYIQKIIASKPKAIVPEWFDKEPEEPEPMDEADQEEWEEFIKEFRNEK